MVEVDDAFLQKLGLTKGGMQLIDENRSRVIFSLIAEMNIQTAPGGSSANTVAGVATLGGKGAFFGRVADDEYGRVYIRKTEDSGVFSLISAGDGLTGHAITFITPDSERTFATHLGAALRLSHEDVDYSALLTAPFSIWRVIFLNRRISGKSATRQWIQPGRMVY
jgi:sugar/nucleoside kinase (ribokinase family)